MDFKKYLNIRCEMMPAFAGGEQQACISGGFNRQVE